MIALLALTSPASAGLAGPTWDLGAGLGAAGDCGVHQLSDLALCSPSDPMVLGTVRRRLVGPLSLGLDLGVQAHVPGYDEEVGAVGQNGITPDRDLPRSTLALLGVLAPKIAGEGPVTLAPLFTAGPGVTLVTQKATEGSDGRAELLPSGFLGIGLRLGLTERLAAEAELRHGTGLEVIEGSTLELLPVGSARLSVTVGL